MKRILLFALVLVLLFGTVLTSCGKKGGKDAVTTEEIITLDEGKGGEETKEDRSSIFDVPENLDYGNDDFTVFTYNAVLNEFGDKTHTDTVSQTVVRRDSWVETRLGVTLRTVSQKGQFQDRMDYIATVNANVKSGSKSWDMIAAYSLVPGSLALEGTILDMRALQYVDFEKTWWPQFMVDTTTVNGKTYFCSGDVSINTLYQMIVMFFNPTLVLNKQLVSAEEDLYDMVRDGTWTVENLFEMTENVSEMNGDDWNEKSIYGVSFTDQTCLDAFYYGTGLSVYTEDDTGKLSTATENLTGDRVMNLYDSVIAAATTYHSLYKEQGASRLEPGTTIFAAHKVDQMR